MSEQQPPYDPKPVALEPKPDDELRELAMALHRSLKGLVVFLERRYELGDESPSKKRRAA